MGTSSTQDYRRAAPVSRRQFGMTTGVAVFGAGLTGLALMDPPDQSLPTAERSVLMGDPANPISAFYIRPVNGTHPGVITWRKGDVMTEAERAEARDLSAKGYAVLVLDRHTGDALSAANDTHQAMWWLRHQPQVSKAAAIGTPEWALRRLTKLERV